MQNSSCSTSEGQRHEALLDMREGRCQQILTLSGHGYEAWQQKKAFDGEYQRLAAIDVF